MDFCSIVRFFGIVSMETTFTESRWSNCFRPAKTMYFNSTYDLSCKYNPYYFLEFLWCDSISGGDLNSMLLCCFSHLHVNRGHTHMFFRDSKHVNSIFPLFKYSPKCAFDVQVLLWFTTSHT